MLFYVTFPHETRAKLQQYTLSSSVLIGSLSCVRAKPPLRAVLKIGLTRESREDRDSCCWVPGHVVFSLKDCIARVNEFYKEIYSSDTYSHSHCQEHHFWYPVAA